MPDISKREKYRKILESLPRYTEEGFLKTAAPASLSKELKDFLHNSEAKRFKEPEYSELKGNVKLTWLTDDLKKKLLDDLQSMLTEWSGIELKQTMVFGIRSYLRGSSIGLHRDRISTHIISAIVNVDQSVDEAWPFSIEDHCGHSHEIYLSPGDMLLYESAKLLHGRPNPLVGEFYSNVFIHYAPTAWLSRDKS